MKTQIKTEAHIYIICNHEFEQKADENGGILGKNLPANAGDMSLIPGLGRSPGEGSGNPLQYSCLENPMDRGSLVGYSPRGHKESDMTE